MGSRAISRREGAGDLRVRQRAYRGGHARNRARRNASRSRGPPCADRGGRGARVARLHHRRPRRRGPPRVPRARPRRASQRRIRPPAPPDHREPRPGGRPEGGLGAGPGDRDRHPRRLRAGSPPRPLGNARGAGTRRGGQACSRPASDDRRARAARRGPGGRAGRRARRGASRPRHRGAAGSLAGPGRGARARPARARAWTDDTRRADPGRGGHQARARSGRRRLAGPRRRARPGGGAACTRDRRRRRPRAAHDRRAGIGQDPARANHPRAAPAARPGRGTGGDGHRLGGRGGAGAEPRDEAAIPGAPSHGVLRRPRGRGAAARARGSDEGTQRRTVPRRAAGVRSHRAGGHPPAARGRPGRDRARERRGGDAGPVPACGGDEPLPVRMGRGPVRALHLPTGPPGPVRGPDLRAVPRPPGPVGWHAAGGAGGAAGASRRRGIGAGRGTGRRGPGAPGRFARPPGEPADRSRAPGRLPARRVQPSGRRSGWPTPRA